MSLQTEASDAMARAESQTEMSAPRGRAFLRLLWFALPTLLTTALVFAPPPLPPPLNILLGSVCVFFLGGYFLETILFPETREISLTRLPQFFIFSLALWAIPATTLQLLGANWFAFRVVFVAVLWVLALAAFWRAQQAMARFVLARQAIGHDIFVALACIVIAFVVAGGPRDADDWGYLQIAQQFIGSERFQIFAASETRYSLRYAFHVWIFLQAFLEQWLRVDVVTLVRDGLPVLLAPLALVSFYAWGKTFFGRANAAFLAVVIQLLILVSWANADGWGRGFFARSAQDKFLVWLIVLPLAFSFAWNFLRDGNFANWFAFGAAVIAGLWVHPISLFLLVLGLGGFALFNLISRVPFSRRRWLALLAASLPALLSPLVIRATTLPAVFRVDTPDVAAYVRLSAERLLFQPPFYLADPTLVAHPLVLLALCLTALLAPRARLDVRAQFLLGSTLVPLALLFNPFTARVLGEMLTPWQLWRVTWLVPAAFLITEGILSARVYWETRRAALVSALLFALIVAFSLSNLNLARSLGNFSQPHALEASVDDVLRVTEKNLDAPANVLLPRAITRFASAYTVRARVLSNEAQKPEDTRGQQIDRFYDPHAAPQFLDAFLIFWEIDFVVAPNGSLQDGFMQTYARAERIYQNSAYTLYRVAR